MSDNTSRTPQNTFQSRPTTAATASPHPATAPHVRPGAATPAGSARVIARIAKPKAGPASNNEAQTTSKATSKRKQDQNRKNAEKATGPKTEKGKQHSSMNALKHGMTARQLLICEGPAAEDPKEFESLRRSIYNDRKPVGAVECMLTEQIVACQWLYFRCLRCEKGYTTLQSYIGQAKPLQLQVRALAADRPDSDELWQRAANDPDHFSLPLGAGLDQILRYRDTTLRERDRAMLELERLQRMRNGESVAAPAKLHLSISKDSH
jgi:hypothetical protein